MLNDEHSSLLKQLTNERFAVQVDTADMIDAEHVAHVDSDFDGHADIAEAADDFDENNVVTMAKMLLVQELCLSNTLLPIWIIFQVQRIQSGLS
jgi:hypothetical protein